MTKESATKRRQRASTIAQAYRQAHEVMSAGLSIVVCAGAGYWLDTKLEWLPALTIAGTLAGCAAAALSLRAMLQRLDKESQQRRQSQVEKPGRTALVRPDDEKAQSE